MPRATEHIGEIIAINQALIDKGFAYESGGDVYFDVGKAPEYGKLSHRDPEDLLAGARIEPSALKRHPGDFALWKRSKPGEPSWESPWGPGRPGLAHRVLGHEHEVPRAGTSTSTAAASTWSSPTTRTSWSSPSPTAARPFASYWLHNGLLTKDGRKISKSDPGTIVLMSDLLQGPPAGYPAGTAALQPLSPPDRLRAQPARRDRAGAADVLPGVRAVRGADRRARSTSSRPRRGGSDLEPGGSALLQEIAEHRQRFLDAMDDDFNTGGALGELFEIAHALNRFAHQPGLEPGPCASRPGSTSIAAAWSCSGSSARSSACSAGRPPPRRSRQAP